MAVDPVLPSEGPPSDNMISKENENNTIQILFINTKSDELGGNPLVPLQQGESPPVQGVHLAIYPVPPLSILVVSFNWNQLARPHLPSNVPFRIIVQVYKMIMSSTIIDEGASVYILSSTTWKVLDSPFIFPETRNLSGFNKETN